MFGYCSINGSFAGLPEVPQQEPGSPIDITLRTEATYRGQLSASERYEFDLAVEPG
jgi:hypothetical protein